MVNRINKLIGIIILLLGLILYINPFIENLLSRMSEIVGPSEKLLLTIDTHSTSLRLIIFLIVVTATLIYDKKSRKTWR